MHPDMFTRSLRFSMPSLRPMAPPSPRETHFWYVVPDEVTDDSLMNMYVELLSPHERKAILQMNKDTVQKGAVLARALVRSTIARYTKCEISPSSLKFRKNKFGKPEVEWKHDDPWALPSLHFNISHTSSLIACGVTMEVPCSNLNERCCCLSQIGIDVEEKQRKLRNNILSFARRYFSAGEVEFLHTFSDPESQRQELLKLWTLKEAYVKALGRGFSAVPFKDFTIRFVASEGQRPHSNPEAVPRIIVDISDTSENITSNWQFGLFELDGSHYAAICLERDDTASGSDPVKLKVWKTLPLVADECVSAKDVVTNISGLS